MKKKVIIITAPNVTPEEAYELKVALDAALADKSGQVIILQGGGIAQVVPL